MKSSRHRSREFAVQGLYEWLVSGNPPDTIFDRMQGAKGFDRIDPAHFRMLLEGAIGRAGELEAAFSPMLDRPVRALSPVERAVLLLGAFELGHCPDVPYRVVINEGVELAKTFGGTDGHKFVNGVLDKLAPKLRPQEAGG